MGLMMNCNDYITTLNKLSQLYIFSYLELWRHETGVITTSLKTSVEK